MLVILLFGFLVIFPVLVAVQLSLQLSVESESYSGATISIVGRLVVTECVYFVVSSFERNRRSPIRLAGPFETPHSSRRGWLFTSDVCRVE